MWENKILEVKWVKVVTFEYPFTMLFCLGFTLSGSLSLH
ncbi:unnamed protein product [Spirodela intermedia]|uniref:Uncharacterized protein n=1 Tax=Spirodela intermedia TaxID=51605 RepID=A0A7I8IJ50_SPIIN|nr:unnamed protein product [Spirodela intermedia]CAA6657770.1 unnamed protein product [Spirodela intermedia]